MQTQDTLARVLYVDLTHNRFWVEDRRDLFERRETIAAVKAEAERAVDETAAERTAESAEIAA